MKRTFSVSILVENDFPTLAEALQNAKKAIEGLGFKVGVCKPVISARTDAQNRALHLFFSLLAEELNEKGFDMRTLIRQEVDISWTPYSVKEYLWRPLQKAIIGKKSTTRLDKLKEINLIWDNLNRIISERTKGEISVPEFPSFERMEENL